MASVPEREQLAGTPKPSPTKGTEHQIVRWERFKVNECRTLAEKVLAGHVVYLADMYFELSVEKCKELNAF